MFTAIKRLFINEPYLALYPITEKSEEEQKALAEDFNSCDASDESETAYLLDALYNYAVSKVAMSGIESESIERNLGYSYKTKKVKNKDKETGKKTIEKVKFEKRGTQKIIERFQDKKEINTRIGERYKELIKAFENSSLTIDHLSLCDKLLEENKYRRWIYTVSLIIVIACPILIFILSKIH